MDALEGQVRVLRRRPLTPKQFNRLRELDRKASNLRAMIKTTEDSLDFARHYGWDDVVKIKQRSLDKFLKQFSAIDAKRKELRLKRKGYTKSGQ